VSVSGSRGQVELSRLNLSRSDGSFEPSTMRLGRLSVSDSVQIYERGSSGLTPVSLSSLTDSVPKGSITGYHTDSSGRVDLIVLRNITGDSATYGRIEPTSRYEDVPVVSVPLRVDGQQYILDSTTGIVKDASGSPILGNVFDPNTAGAGAQPEGWYTLDDDGYVRAADGNLVDALGNRLNENWNVLSSAGEVVTRKQEIPQLKFTTGESSAVYDLAGGVSVTAGFGTISVSTDQKTQQEYARVASTLTAIPKVRSADFYTVDGVTYVQAGGEVYQVADDVLCYNATASSGRWVWSEEAQNNVYVTENLWFGSLLEARSFSATLTLYVDTVGNKVRVVSA
jgi:hypothetical protein